MTRDALLCVVIVLAIAVGGCATRRYVRESIEPVQDKTHQTQSRVNTLNQEIDQNRQRIGDLDRRLATTAEETAETRTESAEALEVADRVTDMAAAARAAAQQTQMSAAQTNQRIDNLFHRLDGYQLVFRERIYFAFSNSGLPKQERPKLDRAIRRILGIKNYIIEIEGFADGSGDVQSNRELTRKRADAVAHYLVVEHGVPLRYISEFGAGSDFPNADNQTPTARRENRRVDLKIYSLELTQVFSNKSADKSASVGSRANKARQ